MWDLPGPGIEPVSPASAGGFLTTAPPGKSLWGFLLTEAKLFSAHILRFSDCRTSPGSCPVEWEGHLLPACCPALLVSPEAHSLSDGLHGGPFLPALIVLGLLPERMLTSQDAAGASVTVVVVIEWRGCQTVRPNFGLDQFIFLNFYLKKILLEYSWFTMFC